MFTGLQANSQDFQAPLDIPLVLSGTFGELRTSHFHSGIDIKTQGREGLTVRSIEEGHVVRIKVSTRGYGKTVYILHPTGHMSVYAHLSEFSEEINNYVLAMQYAKESFEVELFPDANRIPVSKGQIIGKSGNTGGSFGPHLHFEIRNASGEVPENPLAYNFKVKDTRAPELRRIYLYSLDSTGVPIETIGSLDVNGKPKLSLRAKLSGRYFGMAVEAYDRQDAANNLNGNYSVSVDLNGQPFHGYKMDKIPFSKTRYMNAFIDYGESVCCSKKPQRMFMLPNNPLDLGFTNSGILQVDSTTTFNFKISAKDIAGNETKLDLKLNLIPNAYVQDSVEGQEFYWDKINNFISDSCRLYTPDGSFYHNFTFTYSRVPTSNFCPIYKVHRLDFPVHKYMRLLIRPDSIAESQKKSVYAVSLDKNGKDVVEGGTWDGDFMAVKTRSFGDYTLRMDSIAPEIGFVNLKDGQNYTGGQMRFKLKDEGSGIKSYKVTVDGSYLMFEHEPKKSLIFYNLDDKLSPGTHELKIVATDLVGNTSVQTLNFNYVK